MNKVWELTVKICRKHSFYSAYVFLLLNMIFAAVLSLIPGGILGAVLFLIKGTSLWVTMLVTAGYVSVFIGFFGGALYLMRKKPSELSIQKEK